MGNSNNSGGGGMMGGGNGGGQSNGYGAFSEDDGERGVDALAMLGVLASIKDGAGGVWSSYNNALSQKPILVKVKPVTKRLQVVLIVL